MEYCSGRQSRLGFPSMQSSFREVTGDLVRQVDSETNKCTRLDMNRFIVVVLQNKIRKLSEIVDLKLFFILF